MLIWLLWICAADEGYYEYYEWLALANGIRMDDQDMTGTCGWLASTSASKWMTGTNDWSASANGIRIDDWDKWLISFG